MTNPDEISRDAQAGTPLHDRIAMLGVGACSCSTKSPDLHVHMGWCIYRRAIELSEQAESEIDALTAENAALKERVKELEVALGDVIYCDHHNHYDGPPPKWVQIARAALEKRHE